MRASRIFLALILAWAPMAAAQSTLTGGGLNVPGSGGGGGTGTPGGITGDIQTNAGGSNFGGTTPGTGVITALGAAVNGSGGISLTTGPVFVTPTLGAAVATTVNKITLTAPATGATLTLTDGKTLAATNSITLSGTDATVMTFPTTSATIARTDAANTFTGLQSFPNIAQNAGSTISLNTKVLGKTTAPTISGFCTTSPTITASNTYAFTVNVGTSCAAKQTGVVTLPAGFTTGASCAVTNATNAATSVVTAVSTSATNVSVSNFARSTGAAADFTASDVLQFICLGW